MTDQERFARAFGRLIQFACSRGINVTVFFMYRTADQQRKLFNEGKSKCDGYHNLSPHQEGRAADIVVSNEKGLVWDHIDEYDKLAEYWKGLGSQYIWGGDFEFADDIYHFEVAKSAGNSD